MLLSILVTINAFHKSLNTLQRQRDTLNVIVSHIANVLSAPIVISCGAPPITLESSTATTPPSCA